MKISILAAVVLGLRFALTSAVTTEYQLRVLFNDGVAAPGMNCSSDQDYKEVQWALVPPTQGRFLRQSNLEIEEMEHDSEQGPSENEQRQLSVAFYPATCKTACQGFATRTCVAPGCKGFRRELEEMEDDRALQFSGDPWCNIAQGKAKAFLDFLSISTKVSTSCQNLLKQPRNMTCLVVTC